MSESIHAFPSFEDSDASTGEAGQLLRELEARQDEVLAKLDQLDRDSLEVLAACGVTMNDQSDESMDDLPLAA